MSSGTPSKSKQLVAFFAALPLFAAVNFVTCQYFLAPANLQKEIDLSETRAIEKKKPWAWWLAKAYLNQKQAPDVVLFGSSQMGSALVTADAQTDNIVVDALTHRTASTLKKDLRKEKLGALDVFSLAAPGEMISDAYMISKTLLKQEKRPRLVVIGVAPRDFIDATMTCPASSEPFKFYARFESPGELGYAAYDGDFWSRLQFAVDALPLKRLGSDILASISEKQEDIQEASATPSTNPLAAITGSAAIPGQWKVPANIPCTLWIDNTKEYKNRFKNPNTPLYKAEMTFLKAFLSEMRTKNISVLVVGMPSLEINRALLPDSFWSRFRNDVSLACAESEATWYDLTDSQVFGRDEYLDTVHLNAWGGIKLFDAIAKKIAQSPKLASSLTPDSSRFAEDASKRPQ